MNELFSIALLFVGLLNLVISVVIVVNNLKSRINRYFASFTFGIALWAIGLSGFINSESLKEAEDWAKLYYFAPVVIAVNMLLFSLSFPLKSKSIRFVEFLAFILGAILAFFVVMDRGF